MRRLREAGVDFTETARARAEEILQEFSRAGGSSEKGGRPRQPDEAGRRPDEDAGPSGRDEDAGPRPDDDPGPSRPLALPGDPFRAGGNLFGLLRGQIRSELVDLGLAGTDELRELRARVNALDARVSGLEAELAAARRAEKQDGVEKRATKAAAKKGALAEAPGTKRAAKAAKKSGPAKAAGTKKAAKKAAGPSGPS